MAESWQNEVFFLFQDKYSKLGTPLLHIVKFQYSLSFSNLRKSNITSVITKTLYLVTLCEAKQKFTQNVIFHKAEIKV